MMNSTMQLDLSSLITPPIKSISSFCIELGVLGDLAVQFCWIFAFAVFATFRPERPFRIAAAQLAGYAG